MTKPRPRSLILLAAIIAILAVSSSSARIISYAPYTDRTAYPAHQSRTNRHFALYEIAGIQPTGGWRGQLVLYDFEGAEEPRVVFPADGQYASLSAAALRESPDGSVVLFTQTTDAGGRSYSSYLSTDAGATWSHLDLPASTAILQLVFGNGPDNGGPFVSSRYSQIRIGTADFPFVVAAGGAVYAVANTGVTRKLYSPATAANVKLAGGDRSGTRFLVQSNSQLITVDLNGSTKMLLDYSTISPQFQPSIEGFIAADGGVYVEEHLGDGSAKISYVRDGTKTQLLVFRWTDLNTPGAFAVSTSDYSGAWLIERGGGKPTILYHHSAAAGLEKMWQDVTAPDVEGLHTGSSGEKVLIQVHRPRPGVDQRVAKDPALAVWRVGQPAPRVYDELFLSEGVNKGFVHLDVEKIEAGEMFVFDSGAVTGGGGGIIVSPPTAGGGSDVVQEWGVVRASLKQRLVIPTVGRTRGAFGSDWVSDVIIQNPLDNPQTVILRYVPSGDGISATSALEKSITLFPREIRMISDIAASLFQIDSGVGALFITPESTVTATSRTYSRAASGTFGFGMNAIDVLAAAASSRFPVSFAGAFPGTNYRTNITLTDTSGRGTEASLMAAGIEGVMGSSSVSVTTPANGHQQINFIGLQLGLFPYETGALVIRPKHGTAVTAVFGIDNRTNDATYFPPDLPASATTRTIPAVGHLDGANGSRFRSDLYLFNPSDQPRSVIIEVKAWDLDENPVSLMLTLLPKEARVIRDVLLTAFGKTGIARLRYTSLMFAGSADGVRVTSRTYNVDSNGGTYGFLMSPLNNFQIGGSADTLEILGAVADAQFRTNIGLVDLTAGRSNLNASARIEILDASSRQVDAFTVNFPMAGGTQINDVFRARGLSVTGPVLIRVTPVSSTIGAYATNTDNITNDSSYLAANLAAKD